eukprot:12317842-Ditylum_brightwellii.AAC.1
MKGERYITEKSAPYKIDRALSAVGVQRTAYFGKALIGPHVCLLLSNREMITKDVEISFLEVRGESIHQGQTG